MHTRQRLSQPSEHSAVERHVARMRCRLDQGLQGQPQPEALTSQVPPFRLAHRHLERRLLASSCTDDRASCPGAPVGTRLGRPAEHPTPSREHTRAFRPPQQEARTRLGRFPRGGRPRSAPYGYHAAQGLQLVRYWQETCKHVVDRSNRSPKGTSPRPTSRNCRPLRDLAQAQAGLLTWADLPMAACVWLVVGVVA